jgi:hypothetical protein
MQALGAPPRDLPPGDFGSYPPQGRPPGNRPGGGRPRGGPGGFLRDRGKLVDYTLKGLGLLGVALVSGFLWFLIRNDPAAPGQATGGGPPSQTAGVYNFSAYTAPTTATDCVAHSTDLVQTYLRQHPCTSMTRSLYTAHLASGDEVITSVAIVAMGSATDARGLQVISDRNATGHVKDLVEDGTQVPNGPKSLQDAGYYSKLNGSSVVIVMTEYIDGTKDADAPTLKANDAALRAVSADAAKQNLGTS